MKTLDIDRPIRLTWPFWLTYLAVFVPVLFLAKPILTQLPLYARVAGILVLPFLAAVLFYSSFQFFVAVVFGGREQRIKFRGFLLAALGTAVVAGIAWKLFGARTVAPIGACGATILANLLYQRLNHKTPNQLPDPTPPIGTPPAEQEAFRF